MNTRTALIIDDERDLCTLLTKILRKGYERVECAYTLEEGVKKAATLHPDMVLLDNNLPDGFGINFVAHLKKLADTAKIVMTSAVNIRELALEAGADVFIEKPISTSLLSEINQPLAA